MQKKSLDFWVGLFVLLGAAALLFLALKAGNLSSLSFEQTYTVTARFDNIGGLKPRAAVKSAGVVVGRISEIKFDDKTYQATVVMELEKRYKFPQNSSIKILTAGLLGEQYIGLTAGSDDKLLAAGDRIKFTQDAIVLESLISQFLFSKAADGNTEEKK
ncbi:outer membrane lipid asymmetry maintenance protein MlaD [Undibacterium sp. YM2]|jgi:phospholipid/cholesterol/gamma-HCH transport system substrate-binding protein|uniref:outer membrane lipid asymmetry maintenance protein MlaD n=1 Tax=unclassified Undibacterium TaxID=2630295 RepID=UPI001331D677|nr:MULTISPECIES: outer membrane lipid asymmetry maintenance protein MlaD [unclassified Undibacterium]BBB63237.1 outer membrane lipid asymmetry maintenance protein MlaD [Undibacterium sp. KW1]BBB69192.1 outer membrane lipid asymmetry maintenance protein MlaD [Undibacterium sp. YM2]